MPKEALKKMNINLSDIMHIRECIANGWSKLEEYYELIDRLLIYAAAVVLNPIHKW